MTWPRRISWCFYPRNLVLKRIFRLVAIFFLAWLIAQGGGLLMAGGNALVTGGVYLGEPAPAPGNSTDHTVRPPDPPEASYA